MSEKFVIRSMSETEADMVRGWANSEGWNPGLYDTGTFYWTDPQGFLIGFLGDKPVGAISAVAYGDSYGFMGFYIVLPEFRGMGYGMKLWNAAINYLDERVIGLDGVVAQQANYRKSGFVFAHRNLRYEGVAATGKTGIEGIVPLSTVSFRTLVNYDYRFFPAKRPMFLKHWIEQPESKALGVVRNDEMKGFGVIRKCVIGWKIGPLYAETPLDAHNLFHALAAHPHPGEQIVLDVPETNPAAKELAEIHGMTVSFETARMYIGAEPRIPHTEWYGVTSFELG